MSSRFYIFQCMQLISVTFEILIPFVRETNYNVGRTSLILFTKMSKRIRIHNLLIGT